ncbi:MAG: hypothetical protein KGO51_06710 [Alphaproteobacteria bacterium]|nr:hypothetical protein [Alphaproteobacteria bacterium]
MTLDADHGHAHEHKTGLPVLDMVIGVSVVFISVLSLIVSIAHGRTMEKLVQQNERMVAASTMPFLTFETSDFDPATEKPRLSFSITNGGVGPAIVDWVDVRYKGRSMGSAAELLRTCCVAGGALRRRPGDWYFGNVSGSILPARERRDMLVLTSLSDPAMLKAADKLGSELSVSACYCSVLEECWTTDFSRSRPKPVNSCAPPKDVRPW